MPETERRTDSPLDRHDVLARPLELRIPPRRQNGTRVGLAIVFRIFRHARGLPRVLQEVRFAADVSQRGESRGAGDYDWECGWGGVGGGDGEGVGEGERGAFLVCEFY